MDKFSKLHKYHHLNNRLVRVVRCGWHNQAANQQAIYGYVFEEGASIFIDGMAFDLTEEYELVEVILKSPPQTHQWFIVGFLDYYFKEEEIPVADLHIFPSAVEADLVCLGWCRVYAMNEEEAKRYFNATFRRLEQSNLLSGPF